ncbi:unnamed protein product [Acanthoscelides obtectus]|uniref:Uncharacterized protein n=1 Tax=Acanthoscelides obtectus TaxID=200917 RepID=A0A9P0Q5X8_ACAOB|nr:unnamed protein product [Acanthoscelides obtectus]CAK1649184.1 hypothetical protein AOBTE_LOCUS16087 [Acanthoscelides obtectus]
MGTSEALVCQQGLFHERIPCTAGSGSCRKGTGRCAIDNICCSQGNNSIDEFNHNGEDTLFNSSYQFIHLGADFRIKDMAHSL